MSKCKVDEVVDYLDGITDTCTGDLTEEIEFCTEMIKMFQKRRRGLKKHAK